MNYFISRSIPSFAENARAFSSSYSNAYESVVLQGRAPHVLAAKTRRQARHMHLLSNLVLGSKHQSASVCFRSPWKTNYASIAAFLTTTSRRGRTRLCDERTTRVLDRETRRCNQGNRCRGFMSICACLLRNQG